MRPPSHAAVAALSLALALPGCPSIDPGTQPLAAPDEAGYASHVHAYVEARCATLDCHGDPGRPLRLFAETGLRARDDLRDAPITEQELVDDAWAMVAVDPDATDPERHRLLLEPLAPAAGGLHHVGGEIWGSTEHPAYRCLAAFLRRELDTTAAQAACTEATAEVALPPPD